MGRTPRLCCLSCLLSTSETSPGPLRTKDSGPSSPSTVPSTPATPVTCATAASAGGPSWRWAAPTTPPSRVARSTSASTTSPRRLRVSRKQGGKRGGGDPALADRPENSSGLQIVVRNLSWNVTSEMLRGTFEQIGEVSDAEVIYHAASGRSKGWGTVRFKSTETAQDAVNRFGGVELAGREMLLRIDRFN